MSLSLSVCQILHPRNFSLLLCNYKLGYFSIHCSNYKSRWLGKVGLGSGGCTHHPKRPVCWWAMTNKGRENNYIILGLCWTCRNGRAIEMLFGVFYASRKKSFTIKRRTEGGRIPVCQLVSHYIVVQVWRVCLLCGPLSNFASGATLSGIHLSASITCPCAVNLSIRNKQAIRYPNVH